MPGSDADNLGGKKARTPKEYADSLSRRYVPGGIETVFFLGLLKLDLGSVIVKLGEDLLVSFLVLRARALGDLDDLGDAGVSYNFV